MVTGTIDVLDVRFGSLWTNIGRELFTSLGINYGDRVEVSIKNDTREVYRTMQSNNEIDWCIAAVATQEWANLLFPNEEAISPNFPAKASTSAGASVAPVNAPTVYFKIQPITTE